MGETTLTREIFTQLFEFFPESFSTKDDSVIPESYKLFDINKKPIYQLHIDPDLTGSWMIPTHKEESTDSFGFWPSDTKLPFANNATYPPESLRPPRRPTDIKIVDKNLKSMLDPKLTDKPNLHHMVFPQPKKPINFKGTFNAKMECLLKKCLTESFLSETFNDLALALFPFLFAEIESYIGDLKDKELPTFDLLQELLMLAGQGSSRMSNLHISGLVGNKLEMRDKILAEFDHPGKTKKYPKGL